MTATRATFGSWRSPITAASITEGAAGVGEVVVDGDDIWWSESRPTERGRNALMRRAADGTIAEVTPPDVNVRTRVHEYGGGAWWVQDGVLVYAELVWPPLAKLVDGRQTILVQEAGVRFADGRLSADGRWYLAVRETLPAGGAGGEAVNDLVAVATDGSGRTHILTSGADFYSSPRLSPDGRTLAWIQWHHPNMPWDHTQLWVGTFAGGEVHGARCVAGGGAGGAEALMQPEWAPSGELHVLSDRNDWWNLYRVPLGGGAAGTDLVPVRTGDFDIGGPQWVFGLPAYAFRADGSVVVDADVRSVISDPTCLRAHGDSIVVAGASWAHESHIVEISRDGTVTMIRPARDLGLDDAFFAPPEAITFPTGGGAATAHALFYRPANPDFDGPEGERPPLVVVVHGGPTAAARRSLHLPLRYWTSRGFAVADVDYRGSSGYGRPYRRALDGQWGVADVEDCVAAARFLAERGDVDPDRLLIRGSSAGGFTVLAALAFHDAFAAGASLYGVTDLEALALDTHKFESRYLDALVGPYPDARDVYLARSPIHHTDRLDVPMIILQGGEDLIVPRDQAERMTAALGAKGVPYAYVLFPNEGHGFRQAPNIVTALEAELSFYAQLFGFSPADAIEPVTIHRGN
jgi:dipeptidyl aminopeptidase/acylaminoacyl peptidase